MSDDELYERLDQVLRHPAPPVDPARVSQVRAQAEQASARRAGAPESARAQAIGAPSPVHGRANGVVELRPRRSMLLAAAASVVGAVAGGTAVAVTRDGNGPGLPLEAIALHGVPGGVTASASVVDHSWGMELLLDVDGLPVGEPFEIAYVAKDGTRSGVGGFVGAAVPVRCRNTSALMRVDAAAIEVTDASGAVVISSTLP